jgi:Raf kinase inhibitor-like YbhB/YbcL family protein
MSAGVRRHRWLRWLTLGLVLGSFMPAAWAQYGVPLFEEEESATAFRLVSPAFESDSRIPTRYTCESRNVSPPLEWGWAPIRTESFALIMDDPDAPVGAWVHWVIYNIPADAAGLPEGVSREAESSEGIRQGTNGFGEIGYGGPCPPPGPEHRYVFRLYALDAMLDLPPGATKEELLAAIEHHVLARAKLVGRYER